MIYATRATIVRIYGQDFLTDLTSLDVPDPDAAVDEALNRPGFTGEGLVQ